MTQLKFLDWKRSRVGYTRRAARSTIRTVGFGLPSELLEGVRNFGAIFESVIRQKLAVIRPTAVGAVLYDRAAGRLYYAASRFLPGLRIHPTLIGRVERLPAVSAKGGALINTLVPNRHAQTCCEFQALNQALLDGARERDLELWCFRAATMEPFPRCHNCRVTVPRNQLARIWTC